MVLKDSQTSLQVSRFYSLKSNTQFTNVKGNAVQYS